jgi:hypothetical protein
MGDITASVHPRAESSSESSRLANELYHPFPHGTTQLPMDCGIAWADDLTYIPSMAYRVW